MPFAQVHYPFENREWFESHFPADFIVEYIGQTRGWFYTLHVLATALFDRPPFRPAWPTASCSATTARRCPSACATTPTPRRCSTRSGPTPCAGSCCRHRCCAAATSIADAKGIVDVGRPAVLRPLWNAWYFFTLYANADGAPGRRPAPTPTGVLDRYILAKTRELVAGHRRDGRLRPVRGVLRAIESFLDALTNWYIRRSRDRFWGTGDGDGPGRQADAFDTLATVLEVLCRVAAPLLPLRHRVDLAGPDRRRERPPGRLARRRRACPPTPTWSRPWTGSGRCARPPTRSARPRASGPGSRCASLTVAAPDADRLAPFVELIADEVNVKEVRLTTDVDTVADRTLTVVFKVAAPRLGPLTPKVAAAAKRGDWELIDAAGPGR